MTWSKLFSALARGKTAPALASLPSDFSEGDIAMWKFVAPYTMTSPERVYALCEAVRYVVRAQIPGDLVECGVWKGGSAMAVARTLQEMKDTSRELHLFDTFEGMPPPSEYDVDFAGVSASAQLASSSKASHVWAIASIDEVRAAVALVGYDQEKVFLIKGRVEETIPARAPNRIALLRLDTDWYESTRHELEHLFPRLSPGGVVIIDDYGHWKGARRATDEYFENNKVHVLLNRIDNTGRVGIKRG